MNQFLDWLSKLLGSWKPWVVVPPWDIAVRVRLGKTAKRLEPGPHFRIPYFDEVTLVNTRLRITSCPPVTLNAQKGKSRTLTATVGYRIADPLQAMMKFDPPSTAIDGVTQSVLSQGYDTSQAIAIMRRYFLDSGVTIEFLTYTDDVLAQPIRLLQNSWGINTPPATPERY